MHVDNGAPAVLFQELWHVSHVRDLPLKCVECQDPGPHVDDIVLVLRHAPASRPARLIDLPVLAPVAAHRIEDLVFV